MEQTCIYDILQSFSDRKSMENDLKEIKKLVSGYFEKKYFKKINNIISSEISRQKTNPSDDIRLLYAIKPYAKSINGDFMDRVIEAAAAVKAIDNISGRRQTENRITAAASADIPSVNPDGVYDIDRECLIKTAKAEPAYQSNMLLLFTLAILILQ